VQCNFGEGVQVDGEGKQKRERRGRIYPTSYTMGTGGSFLGVKRQGLEADHSPPTIAEDKKMWIYTSAPLYVFMA
jgi:hypothetical protein